MTIEPRKLNVLEALSNENHSELAREVGVSRPSISNITARFRRDGNLSSIPLDILRWLAIKHDLDLWYLIFNEPRPTYEQALEEMNHDS